MFPSFPPALLDLSLSYPLPSLALVAATSLTIGGALVLLLDDWFRK